MTQTITRFVRMLSLVLLTAVCTTRLGATTTAANLVNAASERTSLANTTTATGLPVSVTLTATAATCYNAHNGSITSTVSGATGALTYMWSNGKTTANIHNLAAGTYTVTVTDATGTSGSASATVAQPAMIIAYTNCIHVCPGSCNGSATITVVSGGTSPYTYHWANGATTQTITGLCVGVYWATITDAHGCTKILAAAVTASSNLSVSGTSVNPTCNGNGCNGSITVSASGGTPPYNFVWSNASTHQNLTNLCAGTYTVSAYDNGGCFATHTFTLTQPTGPTVTVTPTNPPCFGGTGSLTANATGGASPLSYMWSNGATTATISGLGSGTYTVTVTDNNGCAASASGTITVPTSAVTVTATGGACSTVTACVGTASATATGGTGALTYAWNNGSTTASLTGLCAGVYSVTVHDANGCSAMDTATVTLCPPVTCTDSITISYNAPCNATSATLTAMVTNAGATATSYHWANGATTASITVTTAGQYCVTIEATAGGFTCTGNTCTTVTFTAGPALTVTSTNGTCAAPCSGTATVTANGGSGFTYAWSNNATTASITGLCAGTYHVTVTNSSGCSAVDSVTITAPSNITVALTPVNPTCFGSTNGSVTAVVSGATGTLTYLWNTGATTSSIHNLAAGTYSVTVTSGGANGCTASNTTTLTQPGKIIAYTVCIHVCPGACNGTATVVVASGGTAPFTYHWSTGETTATIGGLCVGVYWVTVTDAHGCTKILAGTVSANAPIVVTGVTNTIPCYGSCNGTITLTVTGGQPTGAAPYYHFSWNDGSTVGNRTGLCAGTYTVTVTDLIYCTGTATFTLTQPDSLHITLTTSNPLCYGGTGTASVATVGGTGAGTYHYVWSNGSTTASVSGLAAGSICVTVTDNNGCTRTACGTIAIPTQVVITPTSTNVTCYGACNGTASVTVAGGTGAYTYAWSNTGSTASATGLCAGTYTVTVNDANNCSATHTFVITQPDSLHVTVTTVSPLCYGTATASASVAVTGGTGAYTYAWSNGATTSSISGIATGTYTVTVHDANGCSTTGTGTVNNPTQLVATATSTNITCNGACNGTLSVSATGGTAPYTYHWSNNGTATSATGICAGTYYVTVTDAHQCTAVDTAVITQPNPLVVTPSHTNVTCYNACNGTASVTVTGGTGAYTYAWSNTGSTASATGLCAGTYHVTVHDANGCSAVDSVVITQPIQLVVTLTPTSPVCYGSTGSIVSTVTGGTGTHTYLWSNGATTANLTGLAAGTYIVTVTDANQCSATGTATITIPTQLTVTTTVTNVTCFGGYDGSITAAATGGTAPYTIDWDNGDMTWTTSGLTAGIYCYTVTDFNGCVASGCDTVLEGEQVLAYSVCPMEVTCPGVCDASIDVTVTSGVPPFTFLWSNGATTEDLFNLCPGTYTVTITDALGCSFVLTHAPIMEPAPITATNTHTNATCNGACNGTATVTATGGTGNLSIIWSNGATTWAVTGLCAGTYHYTVNDSVACSITDSVIITQPNALVVSASSVSPLCYGTATASATATATGGTGAYTYAWSNGASTATITGVASGTYNVTVTDANGCSGTATTTVNNPSQLVVNATGTNVTCYGACNGTLSVTATGGTGALTYAWSNSGTATSATGICAGTYYVTVHDANQCSAVDTVMITQPNALVLTVAHTNVTCNGACNGTATATISGGTGAYTYAWSNTGTAASASGLCAGTYHVTVSDANGCTAVDSVTITQPNALTVTAMPTSPLCYGSTGSITATANGGTGAITFHWSNSATTATITGLAAGTYTVTVIDANQCSATATATITIPNQLTVTTTYTDVTCYGLCNGTAAAIVTGGTGAYTYAWSNSSATTDSVTGLCAGAYTISVHDANGCTATVTDTIDQPTPLSVTIQPTDITCNGLCNGAASVAISGGTGAYTVSWSNSMSGGEITGLCAGTYTFTVSDANGCTLVDSVTIAEPLELNVVPSATPIYCAGDSSTASVAVSGGTGPYTIAWFNGSSDNSILVGPGTWCVTVTDANLCSSSVCVTVSPADTLLAYSVCPPIACYGQCDGFIDVTVLGGAPPYTYLWNDGATTQDRDSLCPGLYTVTITDMHGCTFVLTHNLAAPTALLDSVSHTNDTNCLDNICNGTATVYAYGGTAPYDLVWSNGATSTTITGLCPDSNYTVTITDANGCSRVDSVHIGCIMPPPCTPTITITGNLTPCAQNGPVTLGISGIVTDSLSVVTYWWHHAGMSDTLGTGPTLSVTASGDYCVHVVNTSPTNACFSDTCTVVTFQPTPVVTATSTNPTCSGSCNGTASVAVSSTANYTIAWSNAATTSSLSGLCAGTYSVTVTSAAGCTAADTVVITAPAPVTATVAHTNVTCFGSCNGTATITAAGGTGAYTYAWSNSGTMASATGLCAGNYTFTVHDANGCSTSGSVTITTPDSLHVVSTPVNPTCANASGGSVTLTITGGTGAYTVNWDNGSVGTTVNNLTGGTYCYTVHDANGCSTSGCATLTTPPTLLAASFCPTMIQCNGSCTGSIDVTVYGGTAPYTYVWSATNGYTSTSTSASTTESIIGLCAGTYTLTVTDANGCSYELTHEPFMNPEPLLASTSSTNVSSCANGAACNGTATVTAMGGTTPYNYTWSNGATAATATGLCAGSYSVTVADWMGCTTVQTVTVGCGPAAALNVGFSVFDASSCDSTSACNGSITLDITGGSTPYTIHWSNGATGSSLNNLCTGPYTYTVTDASGATDSYTLNVSCMARSAENESALTNVSVGAHPNPFAVNSTIDFTLAKDDNVTLEVYTVTGVKVAQLYRGSVKANQRYTATLDGAQLADGMYIYRLVTTNGTYTGNLIRIKD